MKIQWTPNEFTTGMLWGVILCVLLYPVPAPAILWAYLGIVIGQSISAR